MRAIQCFSSKPMLNGRQASGLYGKQPDLELPESVLLCMKLSAQQWRRLNGPIKLYTDTPMKRYLEEKNMLGCWDTVDTEVLDNFYQESNNIDFRVFWSAGKFACYLKEKAPFVCIDTDLIVWKRLEFEKGLDFAFAHWESVDPGDESYPDISQIHKPEDYDELPENLFPSLACNMSITYFGNDQFRDKFATHAMAFMRNNHIEANNEYALPEILYMEQRLPLAIAHQDKLRYMPVLDCTWSPKNFRIIHPGKKFKNWFFSDLNQNMPFTHLWFHKKYLSENETANASYCKDLRMLIKQDDHLITYHGEDSEIGNAGWLVSPLNYCAMSCSKCENALWLSPDDPDFTEDLKKYTKGGMYILYCPKHSSYRPVPPGYNMGRREHSSIASD